MVSQKLEVGRFSLVHFESSLHSACLLFLHRTFPALNELEYCLIPSNCDGRDSVWKDC